MQKEEENLQESTLPETDEQPAAPDAESAQDEEYSDDPVISGGGSGEDFTALRAGRRGRHGCRVGHFLSLRLFFLKPTGQRCDRRFF